MKTHNISKLTAEPDPDGVAFTLRVQLETGGDLVVHGSSALDTFMELACIIANCYNGDDQQDERAVH